LRAPAPDTLTIEPPEWLPAAVRKHVLEQVRLLSGYLLPDDFAAMRRLATEPRMRYVWQVLDRRGASDQELVEFFNRAWQCALLTPPLQTPQDRVALAKHWDKEAELLRLTNPDLAQSFVPVSVYFSQVLREKGRSNSPLLVKRHNRKRGNDQARAYVRALSNLTRKLFGKVLTRTVATTATIALRRPITERQVRNWAAN
jgi:hypothetical protein